MSNTRWGCPWHGLLKGARVNLPNGETVRMAQPNTGDTHLIDFGIPAIETPPSQAALGMQWLNKAIICVDRYGNRLHGINMPRASFIYRDDNGDNWLVDTSALVERIYADGRAVLIRLTRFGVLQDSADEPVDYHVTCPDAIADVMATTGSGVGGSGAPGMKSVHPAGRSAVYSFPAEYPLSWLQISLSGPGDDCRIEITIARTAAQTLGETSAELVEPEDSFFRRAKILRRTEERVGNWEDPEQCAGRQLIERIDLDPAPEIINDHVTNPGDDWHQWSEWERKSSHSVQGAIIGLSYSQSGELVEFLFDAESSFIQGAAAPEFELIQVGQRVTTFAWDESTEACKQANVENTPIKLRVIDKLFFSAQAHMRIRVGGEIIETGEQSIRREWITGQTISRLYYPTLETTEHLINFVERAATNEALPEDIWSHDGVVASSAGSLVMAYTFNWPNTAYRYGFSPSGSDPLTQGTFSSNISPRGTVPRFEIRAPNGELTEWSVRKYANHVMGVHRRQGGELQDAGHSVLTTGGRVQMEQHIFEAHAPVYASYNPITGEVARTDEGFVSWT